MPSRPVLIGRGLVPHTTKTLTTNTHVYVRVHACRCYASTTQIPTNKPTTGLRFHTTSESEVDRVTAAIANGKHPDPYRTRKLSLSAPMVLQPTGCGRVGRRRTFSCRGPPREGWPSSHFRACSRARRRATGRPQAAR